jgi:tRNA A-37 threonylcarbamoyl transferase component Bud32/predicted nucleotidyltransferase
MSSGVSSTELEAVHKCIKQIAKGRNVTAACIYGSRIAGYARPDSDLDIIVVLENYSYKIKYVYAKELGIDISALVVNKKSLERDAKNAHMGEFVVGRLLHIYEPIINPEFFSQIEKVYKRRVILEELQQLVRSTSTLATEISFPLEYIAFSKVKHRAAMYPNAAYSYLMTYTSSSRNLDFAMHGYRQALAEIVIEDPKLFVIDGPMLRLSSERMGFAQGKPALRLTKKLQYFSSYFIHSYAGRRMFHLAVKEAESKIRRHMSQHLEFPMFLSCPACVYWKIPEGKLVVDRHRDWLDAVAEGLGTLKYSVKKRRLGNQNSRTLLYVLKHEGGEMKIVAKELARTKSVKWAALNMWTAQVKKFKVDSMFRLGTEYRALRYLRTLGLKTPEIKAVVMPDRRMIVTQFIDGPTLADTIRGALSGNGDFELIREVGRQFAIVHAAGACFGNIKPKNVIVGKEESNVKSCIDTNSKISANAAYLNSENSVWFTDLEQFVFEGGDPVWDLAQFLCWGLKGSTKASAAAKVTAEFLKGYENEKVASRLGQSKRYIENFYPVLSPQVAKAIRNVALSL